MWLQIKLVEHGPNWKSDRAKIRRFGPISPVEALRPPHRAVGRLSGPWFPQRLSMLWCALYKKQIKRIHLIDIYMEIVRFTGHPWTWMMFYLCFLLEIMFTSCIFLFNFQTDLPFHLWRTNGLPSLGGFCMLRALTDHQEKVLYQTFDAATLIGSQQRLSQEVVKSFVSLHPEALQCGSVQRMARSDPTARRSSWDQQPNGWESTEFFPFSHLQQQQSTLYASSSWPATISYMAKIGRLASSTRSRMWGLWFPQATSSRGTKPGENHQDLHPQLQHTKPSRRTKKAPVEA